MSLQNQTKIKMNYIEYTEENPSTQRGGMRNKHRSKEINKKRYNSTQESFIVTDHQFEIYTRISSSYIGECYQILTWCRSSSSCSQIGQTLATTTYGLLA